MPTHRLATTAFFLASALALIGTTGCKRKKLPFDDDEPRAVTPRRANDFYSLSSVCGTSAATAPFDGAPAYVKGASAAQPSKVAVYRRWADEASASYAHMDASLLGVIDAKTGEESDVQLVACLDATKEPDEPGYCRYDGGTLKRYAMKMKLRVIEVKTGRKVLEDELVLDHKTSGCPFTYVFPKDATSVWDSADPIPKVGSELMPLEPEGVALGPARADQLDDVCSGSAVPQAARYVPGAPTRVHMVYFPDPKRSDTHRNPPAGLPAFEDASADVTTFSLVACITGRPKKKRRACEFTSGKTLSLDDGDFELRMMEARTGKLVDTKSFKGTSPDGCPYSYEFWSENDEIITRVEPALGKYLASFRPGATAAASSAHARR